MLGTVKSDPLFVGLTRPTMIFGVSLQFAVLNMMIIAMLFIQTSNFKVLFIGVALHGVGYYISFREPRFIEIYINKLVRLNNCRNKDYYGADSYNV